MAKTPEKPDERPGWWGLPWDERRETRMQSTADRMNAWGEAAEARDERIREMMEGYFGSWENYQRFRDLQARSRNLPTVSSKMKDWNSKPLHGNPRD